MSDQTPEAPTTDEPQVQENSAPASGTSAEGFTTPVNITELPPELQSRAQELEREFKSAYTKKTQEHAERLSFLDRLQSDAEVQAAVFQQLAEHLGYDLEALEGDDDDLDALLAVEDDDPYRDPRVDELLAERDQQKQAAEWDQFVTGVQQYVDSEFEAIGNEIGRKLTDEEQEIVSRLAIASDPTENGPDIRGAHKLLEQYTAAFMDRWIESKKTPQTVKGVPGSAVFDPADEGQRRARAAAIVAAFNTNT